MPTNFYFFIAQSAVIPQKHAVLKIHFSTTYLKIQDIKTGNGYKTVYN